MLFSWNSASRNFATSPLPLVVHHESPHWKIPLKPPWYAQANAKVDQLKMNILLLTKPGNDQAKPTQSIQFSQIFCGGYLLRIIDVAIVWDRQNICHKNYKCYSLKRKRHDFFPVRRGMQLRGPPLISASLICQVLFLPLFSLQTLWHPFILIETHSMGLCM